MRKVWFYKPSWYWHSLSTFSPVAYSHDENARRVLVLGWTVTGKVCVALWACRHVECLYEQMAKDPEYIAESKGQRERMTGRERGSERKRQREEYLARRADIDDKRGEYQDKLARSVNAFRREYGSPTALTDVKRAMQAVLEQLDQETV